MASELYTAPLDNALIFIHNENIDVEKQAIFLLFNKKLMN